MPNIITFFAAKGGVGRTTAVRATASALLWANKSVLILDLTSVPEGPTPLQNWEDLMVAQGFGPKQLSVRVVRDIAGLTSDLRIAEREKVDFVLVDTPSRPSDLVLDILRRSTLIVCPANGDTEAALISDAMKRWQPDNVPTYGLVTGVENPSLEGFVQACFVGMPTLKTALPQSHLFPKQIDHGDLYLLGVRNHADQAAQTAARRLGEEVRTLCARSRRSYRPPQGYTVAEPLATGHPLAHLRELHLRNPHIMNARFAE